MELLEENEGTYLISVNFENKEDLENFVIPDWFGEEIKYKDDFRRRGITLKNKPKKQNFCLNLGNLYCII